MFSIDRHEKKETSVLKVSYTDSTVHTQLTERMVQQLSAVSSDREIIIVCVGTDRSTGDALGPLVGTSLSKYRNPGFRLYGTLDEPVHAVNLQDTLNHIQSSSSKPYIVGIDACLGQVSSVGVIQVGSGPVKPGAGVNKELPPVGDMHVTGIVNVGGFMEYFVLQNTRLSIVMKMSDIIANSLYYAIKQIRGSFTSFARLE